MANQELAELWEDEYWEQVIKESNLAAEIVKAKDNVVDCAVHWHEHYIDHASSYRGLDDARSALLRACSDLQALRGTE